MNATTRALVAGALLVATLAPITFAQSPTTQTLDQGRLVVYSHDRPVASERFRWDQGGDSITVIAIATRQGRKSDGTVVDFEKSMQLVMNANDFGMTNYISNESSGGPLIVRSILPGDTALTVYTEVAGKTGDAVKLVRPPGRIFAMDAGLFTLFDVIGRSLHGRLYGPRPVGVVTLSHEPNTSEIQAAPAAPDTVRWEGKRILAERIALADSTSAWTMWLSPEGHLLRLQNDEAGLVVMRDPAPQAVPRRGPKPAPKPVPPRPAPAPPVKGALPKATPKPAAH